MAYTKTTWENRNPDVPINDANLNKIEEGIRTAHVTADQAASDITTLQSDSTTNTDAIAALQSDSTSQQTEIDANTSAIAAANPDWRLISVDPDGNIVAANVDKIFISFAAASNVLLPAAPTMGASVRVGDAGSDFGTNNCTFQRNGKKIMGLEENLVLNVTNGAIELAWSGDTYGWVIVSKAV